VLEKTQQFHNKYNPQNPEKMAAQVLLVVDEELSFWDKSYGRLTEKILSNRYPIAKTGSVYDLFLRSDLPEINAQSYQVIWLMGMLRLSPDEEAKIKMWQERGTTVLWTNDKGTSLYFPGKAGQLIPEKFKWSPSELREIWKKAGVHQYIATEDIFYVGRNWLSVHSVAGGDISIQLPYYAQVIDPLTNKVMSDSTKLINIRMDSLSTVLFRVHPL
jgi:beta-galactosidase